ncbi:hypothetical protein P5G61_13685 [Paenibacillus sp. F6_3S_P_1C]|uniref:Uncharacterized protein n=1 Tax=Paenibacillus vandeheii TaxID=3035917 RepID=A0ABT8JCD2_9BACL|nr:hypothetical protein [Paenibacillus vandeheii]MDN4602281.1 hypothetical protein [Paenibacillus vandeheii]
MWINKADAIHVIPMESGMIALWQHKRIETATELVAVFFVIPL